MIDSILRRPFSVFEVIREGGRATAISILNKRAGRNTRALYDVEPGERVACLGPLGRPFTTETADHAWMVAGGVGLAPFATLAESLARAGMPTTLFYGARSAASCSISISSNGSACRSCWPPRTAAGARAAA